MLSLQGAVSEHFSAVERTLKELKKPGRVFLIRQKRDIDGIDALIIPGGESTTIARILTNTGIYDAVLKRIEQKDLTIMGTCAGCVLLAKDLVDPKPKIGLLSAMDMQVERNAFGRQCESFEHSITIKGLSSPFNAVFIRAPVITKVWGDCEVLATLENKIVMAKQENFLALSFHPELTNDLRIHRFFIKMLY